MHIITSRSFLLGALLTGLYFGTGILFYTLGWSGLNVMLFIYLPLFLGVAIGLLEHKWHGIFGAAVVTCVILGALYLVDGATLICIALVLPIMAAGIGVGVLIAWASRRYKKSHTHDRLPALTLPLLPFLILSPISHFYITHTDSIIEVRTEQVFPYAAVEVFDAIKSVDTLIAEKPLLMKIDLPIPGKCVLEKEVIGGIRTCYFKPGRCTKGSFGGGTITERITEIVRPESSEGILRMDVIDYNLVGREWLGFKEAIYYFHPIDDGHSKLTRITTYTSALSPRWYWEPLEKIGMLQEHQYVFANLANDLRRAADK